jgi:glucosamine--fructose-6-phosphate aminotransferase (isomerizing)
MCGIVACIADNCSTTLYNGLVQLKNRGYDSVGLCSMQNNDFIVHKYASGSIYEQLQEQLYHHHPSTIGIAHTRWATHGAKTTDNAHPHISMCGTFSLVHNGIIENNKILKEMLIEKNYVFTSETDTEVIVQLLSYLYTTHKNVKECIATMVTMMQGTWGLAILCKNEPDTLYCVRQGSPLLVGYSETKAIVVSEKSAFCENINYFVLNNSDICTITKTPTDIQVFTQDSYSLQSYENVLCDITPAPYPHWTLKEIQEQPETVVNVIGERIVDNRVILKELELYQSVLSNIDNLILLGCGSSYFAGEYGVHFFKELCHFNTVQVFDGAEFQEQDIPHYGSTAFILISQSGETKDLHRCIEIGKKHECILIGVVNVVDSLITREVNCSCYLNAGREVSVASTKAYTAQIILLSMMAVWFSQHHNMYQEKRQHYLSDLKHLNHHIQMALSTNVDDILPIFANSYHCFVLGKGKTETVAKEGALKMKEITYIHSEGYSTSSLKHGPFALLDDQFPVIILAPQDDNYAKVENAYEEIKSRNAPIVFITDNAESKNKKNVITIPTNTTFKDLLCIYPLQLLAYKLAICKGINPDVPKNLAKVVTVE